MGVTDLTTSGRTGLTRRGLLRGTLGAALGLALAPSLPFAQNALAYDPTLVPEGQSWAVTTGEASLRSQPEIADNRFGFARAGTPLQVLGYTGDWAYVFNPRTNGNAYVSSGLLAPSDPPSPYAMMPAPPLAQQLQDTAVITQDSNLYYYPSPDPAAVFQPLQASSLLSVQGTVYGIDGATWYQTSDFYYFPVKDVFLPSLSGAYTGRWLLATLLPSTHVDAYDGQTFVRRMGALRGIPQFPTPTGTFSILRRVPNETMDSLTLGIPHDSPYGYYVKNVLFTQYFTPDGASLHDNYWSSNWGNAGSHGCLGLSLTDSKWLWDWAAIGTPVVVNPS